MQCVCHLYHAIESGFQPGFKTWLSKILYDGAKFNHVRSVFSLAFYMYRTTCRPVWKYLTEENSKDCGRVQIGSQFELVSKLMSKLLVSLDAFR